MVRAAAQRRDLAARARRGAVRVLVRATRVPVVGTLADVGMRTLFDGLAPNWEQIRADPTYEAGFGEALALLPEDVRVRFAVDVGAGTGLATALVLERFPRAVVLGIDVSPRMVTAARDRVPDAAFEVASSRSLPVVDASTDLVVALDGVIDVGEIVRVLAPRGHALVVYSKGGTTPVSIDVDDLAAAFEAHGAAATAHRDGTAHVVHAIRA